MNNFQRVFRNTLFLTASEVLLKTIGFFWTVYLAHSLSVAFFGRYNLVNALVGIFSFLPDLGVGVIVIREIAKKKKDVDKLLGNSFFLNGFLAFITFFVILVMSQFLQYSFDVRLLIIIASTTLFFSTIRSVGIFYFDGMEKMQYSAFLNSLNTILMIFFGFLSYVLGFGLPGIFLGMLFGTLVSMSATWLFTLRFIVPKISLDVPLMKHLLFEGLPLGVASFSALVYTEIDTIMLSRLLDERSVGIYSSATPFVFSLIQLLNVPFVVAVYPALSRLSYIDKERFKKGFVKSLLFIAAWSFPAALTVSFLSPVVVPFVFGQKYREAIPLLSVLIYFVPFASLSALLYKVLIIMEKQRVYLLISICGAILNILLNISLIPKMGIFGAAYASILTQGVLFTLYFMIVHRYMRHMYND